MINFTRCVIDNIDEIVFDLLLNRWERETSLTACFYDEEKVWIDDEDYDFHYKANVSHRIKRLIIARRVVCLSQVHSMSMRPSFFYQEELCEPRNNISPHVTQLLFNTDLVLSKMHSKLVIWNNSTHLVPRQYLKWKSPKIAMEKIRPLGLAIPSIRHARYQIIRKHNHHTCPHGTQKDLFRLHIGIGIIFHGGTVLFSHLLVCPVLWIFEEGIHVSLCFLKCIVLFCFVASYYIALSNIICTPKFLRIGKMSFIVCL